MLWSKKFKKYWVCIVLCCTVLPLSTQATNVEVTKVQGQDIWYVSESSLPIVSARIAFRHAGGSYVADGKEGLPNMVASLLLEGAGGLDQQAFNRRLEEHAIYLTTDIDKDNFYINIRTLKKNFKVALDLLSKALNAPHFDEEAIERIKNQAENSLQRKHQSPQYWASLTWNQSVYGAHPYSKALYGTFDSIASITKQDIVKWYADHIAKDVMLISVAGDVTEADVQSFVSYMSLPATQTNVTPIKTFSDFPAASIIKTYHQSPQAAIMFGMEGPDNTDSDFYATYIANYILGGGGLKSRLMQEIREKRGLAYSVASFLSGSEHVAYWKGVAGTKTDSIDEVIALIRQELQAVLDGVITREEFENAKHYLTGSFVLGMDTNDKLVRYLNYMQAERLGRDFLSKRNEMVRAVTFDDMQRAIRKWINPERLTIVAAGDVQ